MSKTKSKGPKLKSGKNGRTKNKLARGMRRDLAKITGGGHDPQ